MTTTTATFRPLTNLELEGVSNCADRIVEDVAEVLPLTPEQWATLNRVIRRSLMDNGPMLPKLLGTLIVEHALTGDQDAGEADPPEDGLLGQAIDEYLARALPLVRHREPVLYSKVIEGNE